MFNEHLDELARQEEGSTYKIMVKASRVKKQKHCEIFARQMPQWFIADGNKYVEYELKIYFAKIMQFVFLFKMT